MIKAFFLTIAFLDKILDYRINHRIIIIFYKLYYIICIIYIYIFVFIFIYIYTLPACMQHASGYKGSHRFTRMRFLFFFSLLNQSCQRIDRRTSRVTRDRWTTGHVKRWSDTDKHEQMRSALCEISFDWFKFELKRDSEWRVEKWREASIRRPIFSSPRGFLRFTFQIVLHLIHTWYYLSIVEESLWVETIEQRLTTLIEFSQSEMRTRAVRYFFTTTVTGNWWYRCTSFVFVVIVRSMKLWKKIRI